MRVAMIGPDLNARGGIASLARTFLGTRALQDLELRYFPSVGNGRLPQRLGQMARGQAGWLGALLRGWRPDLVHIHVADGGSFWRKLLYLQEARALGVPVVLHNNYAHLERLYGQSPAAAAAVRAAFTQAAAVACVSSDMAQQISAWTGGRARTTVLYNPVDLREFADPGPRPPTRTPTVLFMGAVGARKGVFDLISAWPAVRCACPGARLRVGGDGELDRLRAELDRLGVAGSVEVLGWVRGDARLRLYQEADLYCLPSYAEGLPVSVLEAMASRLAVVSTPVNGTPDAVISGQTGLLVPPGDVPGLGAALGALLTDPARREAMGAAGRRRVEQVFDAEVLGGQLRALWEQVRASEAWSGTRTG